MIDESNAQRVQEWIQEAQQLGAEVIFGGSRNGSFLEPAVLIHTKTGMKIHDEEAFGPVVCINTFETAEEAIALVNDSKFGLQASVFTNRFDFIERCFEELEVGAVLVNKPTNFRVDQMPYGGIKDSGFGREGLQYAMLDFLEPKLLVH
jgi:glyceraldehyde-3-phosphate dehydrogenase (NADP+)